MTRPLPVSPAELQQVALFSTLTETQLRMLCSLMQRQIFGTGAVLLTVGEPARRVFVLQSGTVKVCIAKSEADEGDEAEWDEGESRTIVLNLCGPGAILGEMSALDGQGCSAGVVALEACKTLWMESEAFRDCAEQMLNLSRALVHITQQRFRAATRQLYAHSSYDIEGRLATQLLLFADRYGEKTKGGVLIPLRLYQHDLADMVACSRSRLNAALSLFKAQGCLSSASQNRVLIRDRDKLAAFCP
jgi:CRP/FNR family cyclic AMP-dependent transcriptional regulator